MTKELRIAFHGDPNLKEHYLSQFSVWLQDRKIRETRYMEEEPMEFILEDFELMHEVLGIPDWIYNLILEFHHHNSEGGPGSRITYEEWFYPQFLEACKVGVDYSNMFNQWEKYLLTECLPDSEKENPLIQKVIELHKSVRPGKPVNLNQWHIVRLELERSMNSITGETGVPEELIQEKNEIRKKLSNSGTNTNKENQELIGELIQLEAKMKEYGQITWHSLRVALLGVLEMCGPEYEYCSSTDALPDAKWSEARISRALTAHDRKNFDQKIWKQMMEKFLEMMRTWPGK